MNVDVRVELVEQETPGLFSLFAPWQPPPPTIQHTIKPHQLSLEPINFTVCGKEQPLKFIYFGMPPLKKYQSYFISVRLLYIPSYFIHFITGTLTESHFTHLNGAAPLHHFVLSILDYLLFTPCPTTQVS